MRRPRLARLRHSSAWRSRAWCVLQTPSRSKSRSPMSAGLPAVAPASSCGVKGAVGAVGMLLVGRATSRAGSCRPMDSPPEPGRTRRVGRDCDWSGFRIGSSVQSPFVQCGSETAGIDLMGSLLRCWLGASPVASQIERFSVFPPSATRSRGSERATPPSALTPSDGIPLAFDGSYSGEFRTIEATEVVAYPEPLTAEINDPTVAAASNTTVPLATLDLPRAIADDLPR